MRDDNKARTPPPTDAAAINQARPRRKSRTENVTRRYGRSPLVEKTPWCRWETTTFLGALRVAGFVAPLTVEGPINGTLFRAWVEQHLVPVLKPGDIVVMDNFSSHKVAGVQEAIEAVGPN